jgi:hypothetical protein
VPCKSYHENIHFWLNHYPDKPYVAALAPLLTLSVYPFALILLDLITGGVGKALGGVVGLIAGHLWYVGP